MPDPSPDALRQLIVRWRRQSEVVSGQLRGRAAMMRTCADELESLLSSARPGAGEPSDFQAVARQMYANGRERFFQLVRDEMPRILLNERQRALAWAILEAIGEVSPEEGLAALQRASAEGATPDPVPASPKGGSV